MYAIAPRGDSEMTEKENQQQQVSLEKISEQISLEEPAAVAEASSINLNSETLPQFIENNAEDRMKALARLMMVSLTWSLAELSQPK
jgi:hypothetical protein